MRKILLFLITFLFAFIPLYPKIPLTNVANTFVAIRIEDILIALTVSLWAIYMIKTGKLEVFFKDKLNQAILVFFFIGALSIFSANFLTHSVIPNLSFLHWARRVEFMLLLPVVATVVNSKREFFWILGLLSLVVVTVNMYALGQQYLDWPVISTTNSEFSKGLILRLSPGARVNSTFAGHYDLAVFLAMAITVSTALFFAVRKTLKPWIFLSLGLSMLILIMTAARLSFVAAFVGVIAALFFSKKKKYFLFILIVVAGILLYPSQLRDRFISTITVNLFGQGQRYEGRTEDQRLRSRINIPTLAIQTSSDSASTSSFIPSASTATDITPGEPVDTTELGVYRSFSIRLNLEWPRAVSAFWKNPLLGTGYSSLGLATDNDFLRLLGEVGFLGTASFILIVIESSKRILSLLKSEDRFIRFLSAGIFSMMIAFLVNGLFIDVFEASKVASLFWMMLGLNLAAFNFRGDYVKKF